MDNHYSQVRARAVSTFDHITQEQGRQESKEVSHVFHCMQCDLQFQMDLEVSTHEGPQEIDPRVVRVRLSPHVKLERETLPPASSD